MKNKRILFGVGLLLNVLHALPLHAGYREDLLARGLPIVNSIDEKGVLPGGFRMSKVLALPPDGMPSTRGLAELRVSGSSQFSEHSLEAVIRRVDARHITIVNLRQEDGGFIEPQEGHGAIAFSYLMPMPWWTGEDERGNRSVSDIESSEDARMSEISRAGQLTIYGTSDSYAPSDKHRIQYKIDMAVKRAFTEKQLAAKLGLGYMRIPDKKFGNMEFEHVDMFVDFVKNLPADEWLHFHCKKGQSRTTLFMIMYDMMRNAEFVSADDLIKRQGPLGLGGADLFGLPHKEAWDHSFKQGWKAFLYQFYDYVKASKMNDYAMSWSRWAAQQGITPPAPVLLGDYYRFPSVDSDLPQEDAEANDGVVVLNTINESKLRIQNFRTSADLWFDETVATKLGGFERLRASASNQYSHTGMGQLISSLLKKYPHVVVVDLRPDDHLFVNGLNVSSFPSQDARLRPRSPAAIKEAQRTLKASILQKKRLRAHAIEAVYPKNSFLTRYTLDVTPEAVETPEEFIERLGAHYLLVGANRYLEASSEDVDRFISYMRSMPSDTWYHFHGRKGKSRTTLFMSLFDMLHNADQLSLVEIVTRQRLIGGSDLFDITPKDGHWAGERATKKQWVLFLARFHRYAATNKASGFAKSWSQWSQENADYQPEVDALVVDRSR